MGQKLVAKDYTAIPEKMGKLAANMHGLLVPHVLKAMTSGNDVSCVRIKGLLLDKMLESGIQYEAKVKVCDIDHISESQFQIVTSQSYCGRLNPAWLCFHLCKVLQSSIGFIINIVGI